MNKDEKPNDRLNNIVLPEDEEGGAEVYSLQSLGASWELTRRDIANAATAVVAGAASQSMAQAPVCRAGVAHTQTIRAIAISPDGRQLFSVGADNQLKFWKLPEGAYSKSFPLPSTANCLAVNPSNTFVVAGVASGAIFAVPLTTGVGIPTGVHSGSVDALAYSPDGRFLASAGADRSVYLLKPNSFEKVNQDIFEAATALAFTPDSEFLVVGYTSGIIRILTVPDLLPLDVSMKHNQSVWLLAISADGAYLASGGPADTAMFWSLPSGEFLRSLVHPAGVTGMGFNNQSLITACSDGVWRVWSVPAGTIIRSSTPGTTIGAFAVSPFSPVLATASAGSMKLWNVDDGRVTLDCMIDLVVSPTGTEGARYTGTGGVYTLPCGSPIPAGATCTCNCVSNCSCVANTCSCVGNTCSCVGNTCSCVSVSHYWYPN